jgi:hypothetical protein
VALLILGFLIFLLVIFLFEIDRRRKEREREQYNQTEYAVQTQIPYERVMSDRGILGEFFIYKVLESLEGPRRFLFNLYLPKWNGDTTELDVVLIHSSGIYVFESKNFGGWIFGSEKQQYWTQTLPAGRGQSQKHHFYNPILQNNGHLDILHQILRPVRLSSGPPAYYSYIVFGNRCEFKAVPLKSGNHHILHLGELFYAVQENIIEAGVWLTATEIETLYRQLEPYTQASDIVKQAHVENIHLKYY